MSNSNQPPDGDFMERPEDSVVEELFLELFDKLGWHNLPPQVVLEYKGYPPAKKWILVAEDMKTMKKNYPPSKTLSGRIVRANAIKANRSPYSGALSGGRRNPVRPSSAASGPSRSPVVRRPVAGSMIAPPVVRRPLPSPADIEQELNAEGLQGDVPLDVGPLTQGIARLHVIEAGVNRSLAAGQAEIARRFDPVSFQ